MRRIAAVLLALLFAAQLCTAASARCGLRIGEKVALLGSMDDPDVFVWDSRFRMADYQTGTYDVAKALLPHAWVVPPGTRAVVIACVPGFVHPKYRNAVVDAVGIVMLGGPYRGRSGWITAEDLRRMHR